MHRTPRAISQLALPLDWNYVAAHCSPLIVGESNADIVRYLSHVGQWSVRVAVLVGPPRSGRSLIGRMFAQSQGGRVLDGVALDGADMAVQEEIFHAWNTAQSGGPPLLIIADNPPSQWRIELADLASRLRSVPVLYVKDPDDAMICALLESQMRLRGIGFAPTLARYITAHIQRSYAQILAAVAVLERTAYASGRVLGKQQAKDALLAANLFEQDLLDPMLERDNAEATEMEMGEIGKIGEAIE